MSVLRNRLNQFLNEEIVCVMSDNRAFRGTLMEFDDECLVLRNVVEALPSNTGGWEEPTVSTSIKHKVVTWHGTFSREGGKAEIMRMKDVVIRLDGVLRIWEFSAANLVKPDHVQREEDAAEDDGPAAHVRRS